MTTRSTSPTTLLADINADIAARLFSLPILLGTEGLCNPFVFVCVCVCARARVRACWL
jgi:hypothetical protein